MTGRGLRGACAPLPFLPRGSRAERPHAAPAQLHGACTASGQRRRLALTAVSLPFDHPDVPEKQFDEASRVRGKYVSVERVRELHDGAAVEWRMATSSDAGGNIPRFVTNASLPKSIAEDVPSFLRWVVSRWPPEGPQEGADGFTPGASAPLQAVPSPVA